MRILLSIILIGWLVALYLLASAASATDGLPPTLKSEQPGKMCVAIFDKFNEFVGIDCDVPKVEESGKKEPIRKGE